jgi:hypothetical protein
VISAQGCQQNLVREVTAPLHPSIRDSQSETGDYGGFDSMSVYTISQSLRSRVIEETIECQASDSIHTSVKGLDFTGFLGSTLRTPSLDLVSMSLEASPSRITSRRFESTSVFVVSRSLASAGRMGRIELNGTEMSAVSLGSWLQL